jgi:hypothetical protein
MAARHWRQQWAERVPQRGLAAAAGILIAGLVLPLAMLGGAARRSQDFGLVLRAVRDHEVRCRYLGIDTPLDQDSPIYSPASNKQRGSPVRPHALLTPSSPSLVGTC